MHRVSCTRKKGAAAAKKMQDVPALIRIAHRQPTESRHDTISASCQHNKYD